MVRPEIANIKLRDGTHPVDHVVSQTEPIKYTIEVEGLAIYSESYDVAKLRKEIKENEQEARENWFRRIKCVVECRSLHGFSACVTRCLLKGHPSSEVGSS